MRDETREDLKYGAQVAGWCAVLLVVLFAAYQPPAVAAVPRWTPGASASCAATSAGWACQAP